MRFAIFSLVAALILPAVFGRADVSTSVTLSPEFQSALEGLSSDEFPARNKALRQLETALGRQMGALIAHDDPEIKSRLVNLLEFNEGLSDWAIDLLKLPDDQRKVQLAFALQPDVLPVLVRLFNPDPAIRAKATRELGRFSDPAADSLLAHLLYDPDRTVYISAMDVMCGRPPRDVSVDALWDRAVVSGLNLLQPAEKQEEVTFRGKAVLLLPRKPSTYFYGLDNNMACDTLITIHAPQLNDRLIQFFEAAEQASGQAHSTKNPHSYLAESDLTTNAIRIAVAYKPALLVPIFYRLATGVADQPVTTNQFNQHIYRSSRTPFIAAFYQMTNQDPSDVKVKLLPDGRWAFNSEDAEIDAVEHIRQWKMAHHEYFPPK